MGNVTPDRLTDMFGMQRRFQDRLGTSRVYNIDDFKDMVLALVDELFEALNEMGWKPWATSDHFKIESVQSELVDAWCMMMNLFMIAGLDTESLYAGYVLKLGINQKRQDEGYDGVTTKCPACKRAYDDVNAACNKNASPADQQEGLYGWCDVYGWVNADGKTVRYNVAQERWVNLA